MSKQTKKIALDWVENNKTHLSQWHQLIFHYGETAWREYRSAAWYVERLPSEGFTVEEGSGDARAAPGRTQPTRWRTH